MPLRHSYPEDPGDLHPESDALDCPEDPDKDSGDPRCYYDPNYPTPEALKLVRHLNTKADLVRATLLVGTAKVLDACRAMHVAHIPLGKNVADIQIAIAGGVALLLCSLTLNKALAIAGSPLPVGFGHVVYMDDWPDNLLAVKRVSSGQRRDLKSALSAVRAQWSGSEEFPMEHLLEHF